MAQNKYETHVKPKLNLVECWARDGYIDEDIAKKLGVAYSTFKEYKVKYPDLLASLKKGKEVVDFEVENALLKRALGYKYVETTKEARIDKKTGKEELVVVKAVEKEMPADTTAQIFWLKNRKPDEWRDTKKVDITGSVKLEDFFKE
jgi:hypothetical protein